MGPSSACPTGAYLSFTQTTAICDEIWSQISYPSIRGTSYRSIVDRVSVRQRLELDAAVCSGPDWLTQASEVLISKICPHLISR